MATEREDIKGFISKTVLMFLNLGGGVDKAYKINVFPPFLTSPFYSLHPPILILTRNTNVLTHQKYIYA